MSRFETVDDRYDAGGVETRVAEWWEAVDAYEQTKRHREDGEEFFFVDGPPYTSGSAHMGTTWNKTLKDAYIRYHRMQGYDVTDRPGYDMHGLPIETRVEGRLGFDNKKDIEEFGEQNFIEECKSYATEQLAGLQEDFRSFGVWMDWDDPYRTVDPSYMEAAWWGFSKAHERGLVEQGKRSISQCPRCETAIANNEVEYDHVEDPSIYVKFPLHEGERSEPSERASGDDGPASTDAYLVIWTTTPWTIPANTFVAVDGDATYRAVEATIDGETERLYLEESCVEETLERGGYEEWTLGEALSGEELVGWRYEHPLREAVPEAPDDDGALQVYTADYVEADRTGLVHSAPGHGEVDFERGQELGLEVFCPVGPDGVYEPAAGDYAGQFVKDADPEITDDLKARGLLLHGGRHHHDYGHCWRCDTPVVQMVTDQWYITVTDIKKDLLSLIEDSEWYPQEARDDRFRDFVEESPDWNVSRQRYWGIPIPIWTPDSEATASNEGGEAAEDWSGDVDDAIVVSSREELAERADQAVDPETVDLHKDTVDELTITEGGTTYTRVPDVFDVWLDSSMASWGTLNYPEETDDFERLWPADLIIEAHDQTRGWFWSQLGMGGAALDEIPYRQVVMHGFANMPDGRSMSKSKDILVDPHEVIDDHGVDPMRLFLLSVTPQGDDMRFSWDETAEMERRLNILWNVFRFPLPYMRLDGFDPDADGTAALADADLETVDEWVLSRLQTTVAEMTDFWESFRQDKALDALLSFVVEDVSRFYIQVVRERMWAEEESPSKQAAYATLYRVLVETTKLLAPYAPYVADDIYGTLTGDDGFDTVHMCDWPEPTESLRDPQLEADVDVVAAVEEAGSNARQRAERKLRWPVRRAVVAADDEATAAAVDRHRPLLCDRLNAREIELVDPGADWAELRYGVRADMSVLGPAFGDAAGEVMEAINAVTLETPSLEALSTAVADELGRAVELTDEMVSFTAETPEGVEGTAFDVDGEERGVVYVDATLTETIESEGYAREVVRRVQEMRKELDLDIEAEIRVDLDVADDRLAGLVRDHEGLIAEEVRAAGFGGVADGHDRTWDVEGTDVRIAIEPVAGD
ncbi:isoleucine--tRNA ligase [Halobacteriales archaeon QS_4_69_225]|nr:MAG: isoleucine--tRNA ligase [Halobacteriales archaeon QS_4_69_225]